VSVAGRGTIFGALSGVAYTRVRFRTCAARLIATECLAQPKLVSPPGRFSPHAARDMCANGLVARHDAGAKTPPLYNEHAIERVVVR